MQSRKLNLYDLCPFIVGIMSIVNLIMIVQLAVIPIPNLLVSVFGIIACLLYVKKSAVFKTLVNIWLILQLLIVIRKASGEVLPKEYLVDLSQWIKLSFGINFSMRESGNIIFIGINVIPLILLIVFNMIWPKFLIGKQIVFNSFNPSSVFQNIMPINGEIIKAVMLESEKDWLLIKLKNEIEFENDLFEFVLIKSKDSSALKIQNKQLVFFRVVPNPVVQDELFNKENCPFIEWMWATIN